MIPNLKQYVQYCSVGVDDKARLVPFPILVKMVTSEGENCKPKVTVQSARQAALERDLMVLLINDLYELDQYGFSPDIIGRWFVSDENCVYARDMDEANQAILEIRTRFDTHKEIKRVKQQTQSVRRDSLEEETDRRIG